MKRDKIFLKNKKLYFLLVILGLFLLIFGVVPFIISSYEKHLEYPEIRERINDNVKNAVVFIGTEFNDSDSYISHSSGVSVVESTKIYPSGSGAIVFKKENSKYYALTANHVIESNDIANMYALKYDANWISDDDKSFSKINIEYFDKSKDLAIISFYSDKPWGVLNVSKRELKISDKVFTISSPDISDIDDYYNNKNMFSYGKVLVTNVSSRAKGNSEIYKLKNTFVSSLYTGNGSSGSGIINEKMEIVGIVHAGSKSIFGSHIFSFGIPNDVIDEFLNDWNKNHN